MKKFIILLLIIPLFSLTGFAQEDVEVNVVGFKFLDYQGSGMPKELLKTKSVVFISVPTKSSTSSERGNWHKIAEEAHATFKQVGIDPVKYYYMDDVLAGDDVTAAISDELIKREISNIIILSHVALEIKNKDTERFVMVITSFSGDKNFMKNGQVAWKNQGKDLENVLKSLRKDVSKMGATENLLITDDPEYFTTIDIIRGRRNESFSHDIRIDKLAIPKFEKIEIPANPPGGIINNNIKKEAEEYNENLANLNKTLESAFSKYPYEHGYVDDSYTDKKLRAEGYDYILVQMRTAGERIKELLEYKTDDILDDYVTVKNINGKSILRSIPKMAPVYKYYIKHIYSGDVYLGVGWDADETWTEALENHLKNLVQATKDK
jgi:hypothetical protein